MLPYLILLANLLIEGSRLADQILNIAHVLFNPGMSPTSTRMMVARQIAGAIPLDRVSFAFVENMLGEREAVSPTIVRPDEGGSVEVAFILEPCSCPDSVYKLPSGRDPFLTYPQFLGELSRMYNERKAILELEP